MILAGRKGKKERKDSEKKKKKQNENAIWGGKLIEIERETKRKQTKNT